MRSVVFFGLLSALSGVSSTDTPACHMGGLPWSIKQSRTGYSVATDLDNKGNFNINFNIRHGPEPANGTVFKDNSVELRLADKSTCKGTFASDCNNIQWEEKCVSDTTWCRSWTPNCTSVTPPYGMGFSFFSTQGSNMVLQQAPAKSAVYGIMVGKPHSVKVTVTGEGQTYTVDAEFNTTKQPFGPEWVGGHSYPGPFQMWKAFLKPTAAGGNYTIKAECTGCFEDGVDPSYSQAEITNVTFGDMWYCSGQSNMWLPVGNTFERNHTVDSIVKGGKYKNIRIMAGNSGNGVTNPWMTAEQASVKNPHSPGGRTPYLFDFGAACWYFGQKLTDEMEAAKGMSPPPIGLADTAIGGQRIEEFMLNDTSMTLCSERAGDDVPEWNGQLFGQQVMPFVDMTVKGWVWYQGENNMGNTKGNSIANMGYGCEQRELVKGWRRIWSKTPGTTEPDAPFGIVTLASSGSEGGPNMGPMRQAQTANFGILPNEALPNTFLAQAYDLDDEWGPNAGPCFTDWFCCDGWKAQRNATLCAGREKRCANACAASAGTEPKMGGIHPRSKKQVGDRLGAAAFNTVYGGSSAFAGPTLSGCNAGAKTMEIFFNASLLRGDSLQLQPWGPIIQLPGRHAPKAGGSQLWVQTDAQRFCMEKRAAVNQSTGEKIQGQDICPTWAGGDETPQPSGFLDGDWTPLNFTLASSTSISVDLTPLEGKVPTAVRYAWGIVNCCDYSDPELYVSHGCVANCPIMSSSGLPANPFQAKIVGGQCECVAPQSCSQSGAIAELII